MTDPAAVKVPLPRATRLVLAVTALLGLAVVAHGARFLDVTPVWSQKVMGIGGVLALVGLAVSFAGPAVRLMAVFLGGVLALMLFAFNAYLVFAPPEYDEMNARIEAARAKDPDWDDRTLMQVVRDRIAAGQPTMPYLIGRFALDEDKDPPLLPIAGVSTATTVLCNELGPFALYPADEHGFNNPAGWPQSVDVVVIGDSFAHGSCVPAGQDLAGQLREKGYTAVNLGVSGHGPLFELAALREYGLALEPKAVIWAWSGNDSFNLEYELTSPMLRRYLEPGFSQGLAGQQPAIDAFWRDYLERNELLKAKEKKLESAPADRLPDQLSALLTLRPLRGFFRLRRSDDGTSLWRQLERILGQARDETRARGGELYFLDLPHWYHATEPPDEQANVVFLKGLVDGVGLPQVPFHQRLYETDDPRAYFPYRLPAHYNARGYALLADVVDETIRAQVKGEAP